MVLQNYKCISCGVPMTKKKTDKGVAYYACSNWGAGCKGHIFNPDHMTWKMASDSLPGKLYGVREKDGKLHCDCPAGGRKKIECKHKKRIREHYSIIDEEKSPTAKAFYELKKKGLFKDYSTYAEWQRLK